MAPMTHLGPRVSALLDGQMPAAEAERAWQHVYGCHTCRDLVEREGWVKSRLARLSTGPCDAEPPAHLVGSLLGMPPDDRPRCPEPVGARRPHGLVALGGGAVGVAVMGVLALGAAPASAPTLERRAPMTNVVNGQVPVVPALGPVATAPRVGPRSQR